MFFATQCATYRLLNEAEYREFGEQYDLMVIDAVRSETEINLMHTHGEDIMFDLTASYPIEAMNWHDRLTWPTLSQARQRFAGLLVGGINEWHTLLSGPMEQIQAEIKEAIVQTSGRGLLVGPGCVIPGHTPPDHIRAARQAVET
jgi:uroporphyrinogen decarboxylase